MMRNSFPLALTVATLMAAAPAAAEPALPAGSSVQSGKRVQVLVSARIVSGESLYFGGSQERIATNPGAKSSNVPMARTRGEIILDGQQRVTLVEFH